MILITGDCNLDTCQEDSSITGSSWDWFVSHASMTILRSEMDGLVQESIALSISNFTRAWAEQTMNGWRHSQGMGGRWD